MPKHGCGAAIAALAILGLSGLAQADDFSFEFEWGDIPRCTTGRPNRVDNPTFTVANVPAGTVRLKFRLKDRDAPRYNHGGGEVYYNGAAVIGPGAFKYKSPCPPRTTHTYRWTAKALDQDGESLAEATASRVYPE